MWSLVLKLILISSLQTESDSIVLPTRNSFDKSNGNYLLNHNKPLWVLEDHHKPARQFESFTTVRPYYNSVYENRWRQPKRNTPHPRRHNGQTDRIMVPPHYMNAEIKTYNQNSNAIPSQNQPQYNKFNYNKQNFNNDVTAVRLTMPIFDSIPGDESLEETFPIFIYSGSKGQLILNTMLSAQKYPMQEPVPGDVLYPPAAPMFRSKPRVQRFHEPNTKSQPIDATTSDMLNLKLIPFYAHEAINPNLLINYEENKTPIEATTIRTANMITPPLTTTVPPPTPVLYAAPLSTKRAHKKVLKKRRPKKTKQYSVYRSPQDVHWQPTAPALEQQLNTTPVPMTLASPLQQNHRYGFDMHTTPSATSTTNYQTDYRNENGEFRIFYVDESLEKPTTELMPVTQAPNLLTKEYYAFPVYTLGKLIQPERKGEEEKGQLEHSKTPNHKDEKPNADDEEETLFVLNSRYKGPHVESERPYRLSSKYTSLQNLIDDEATIKNTIQF